MKRKDRKRRTHYCDYCFEPVRANHAARCELFRMQLGYLWARRKQNHKQMQILKSTLFHLAAILLITGLVVGPAILMATSR